MSKAYDDEPTDYTGRICPLYPNAHDGNEWPMYSFNTPAFAFWDGFANGLRERGLTDAQIGKELRSKGVRWLMDDRSEELEALGRHMAEEYTLCVTGEPK